MTAIVKRQNLGSSGPARTITVRPPRNTIHTPERPVPTESQRAKGAVSSLPSMRQRRAISQTDVYNLAHVDYMTFRRRILKLNPGIRMRDIVAFGRETGKMAILVPKPPKSKTEPWEQLTHWEKRYMEAVRGTDGPAREVVSVTRGTIIPFVSLVSQRQPGKPTEVIAHSLRFIIKRLVEAGAFTWESAEREFGIFFRGYKDRIDEVSGVIPRCWDAEEADNRKIILTGA